MNQPTTSVEWLKQHIQDEDLIILDASPISDKDEICIPKSRFFNLKENFRDKENPLPNTFPSPQQFELECRKLGINQSSKIVVYDNLGIHLSPRVWWMFKVMGHENVAVLNGGLPEWIKKEGETGIRKKGDLAVYEMGNFKADFQKQFVITYEEVRENTVKNEFLLVDARSNGRFKGIAPEPRKHLKSGHIPNSVNIPYQNLIEDGKFKPEADLQVIFKSNCSVEKDLVFSCGSGITACIVLVACELVGRKSRYVFDGSWTEWAERQGLKEEKVI